MVSVNKEDFVKDFQAEQHAKVSFLDRLKQNFSRSSELRHERKVLLKQKMDKAGFDLTASKASRIVLVLCIIANLLVTVYAFTRFAESVKYSYFFAAVLVLFIWSFVFVVMFFIIWFFFYLTLDISIFKRRQKLEEVLPDFLQLVSSNVRAGMTIDQALWFAIRPRFGVLSSEIEVVAKRTFAGEPLELALQHFVERYDSKTLERAMNLLIEGLRAGGEIGDLLNKISSNIQETNLMKKEMAANVTTYVIFITFATVMAAPFLFGMAYQLILVIQEVFSRVDISPSATAGFPIAISKGVIDIGDFRTFAIVSLLITSFFSSIIISAIKKGNVKGGVKYIPAFMISSVLLFFVVVKLFSFFVEGFF